MRPGLLLTLHVFAVVVPLAAQTTWYVAPVAGPGTGTMANPMASIQGAIVAATTGDTILVGPGTYAETIDFLGKNITVRSTQGRSVTTIDAGGGGTVVTFTNGEGPRAILEGLTVTGGVGAPGPNGIDGGAGQGGGVSCDGASPTIRDCRITGNVGGPGGSGAPFTQGNGGPGGPGGIACQNSSAVFLGCVVDGNTGGAPGAAGSTPIGGGFVAGIGGRGGCGGLLCRDAPVTLMQCTIDGNSGRAGAQGFMTCIVTICSRVGTGPSGPGGLEAHDADISLIECVVSNNTGGSSFAAGGTGGMLVQGGAPSFLACEVAGNVGGVGGVPGGNSGAGRTGGDGGSTLLGAAAILLGCRITDNTGGTGGQGAQSNFGFQFNGGHGGTGGLRAGPGLILANTLLAANTGANGGTGGNGGNGGSGGLQATGAALINCTLHGNAAGLAGFSSMPTSPPVDGTGGLRLDSTSLVINAIVWSNVPDGLSGGALVRFSDTQDGVPGVGNISLDPLLTDPAGGDYHLTAGSPCIDLGDPGVPGLPPADFEGDPRVFGPSVDLGIDEHVGFRLDGSTAGGGIGDLRVEITGIPPGAVNVNLVASHTPAPAGPGTGPFFGLWPDIVLWALASQPLLPFNPFHFPVAANPYVFGPFTLPPGALSAFTGTTVEATAVAYGFATGPFLQRSNIATWVY